MRFDKKYGILLDKADIKSVSINYDAVRKAMNREGVKKYHLSLRGNPEFIYETLPERWKERFSERIKRINREHASIMAEAQAVNAGLTLTACRVTAESLEINASFIRSELKRFTDKHHAQFIAHYFEFGIGSESVRGYAKLCAIGLFAYNTYLSIKTNYPDEKQQNRMMRSFRVNLLTALEDFDLEVAIPKTDSRFIYWLDNIIECLDCGGDITDVITVKRIGNKNAERLTGEQKDIARGFYSYGNGLPVSQVYSKMLELGRAKKWWTDKKTGEYRPVSERLLYRFLQTKRNTDTLIRHDSMSFYNKTVPEINRRYPECKNTIWSMDGTAHDENVHHNGNNRQYLYHFSVYDYATMRLLNAAVTVGVSESTEFLYSALLGAIRESGYKPRAVQCDQGPAYKSFKQRCETELGIKVIATGIGHARSKIVEQLFAQTGNLINRYCEGWNGQNRTAKGANSHPSERFLRQADHRDIEGASKYVRGEMIDLWNNHIINEMNRKPCGKTPNELWNEKDSATGRLSFIELSVLCGNRHTVKLTNRGLTVENDGIEYTYFPKIDTDAQRNRAVEIFAKVPRIADEASKLTVYVLNYGSDAVIFDRPNGKYLGTWSIKEEASGAATFENDTDVYLKGKAFQKAYTDKARQEGERLKNAIENRPDVDEITRLSKEALTGKKRHTPVFDKPLLNAVEEAGDSPQAIDGYLNELSQMKQYVDEDTGELIYIKNNKNDTGK
jgi:hypothetical protein